MLTPSIFNAESFLSDQMLACVCHNALSSIYDV
jgi:hypothetical protein